MCVLVEGFPRQVGCGLWSVFGTGSGNVTSSPDLFACDVGEVCSASVPPGTEILDLEGRVLSAGFHDAHFHFLQMGIKASRPSLRDCRSLKPPNS